MAFVDEQIAMLQKEWRRQDKKETGVREENEIKNEKMTLPQMLDAVRSRKVIFTDQKSYEIKIRHCFSEKFPMLLIPGFYDLTREDTDTIIYENRELCISQAMVMAEKSMAEESMERMEKQLTKGMERFGVYIEFIKKNRMDMLDYFISRVPTGKGWIYNLTFRIRAGSGRVIGNFNCRETDQETWGLLLEAFVISINELLVEEWREGTWSMP